MWLPELPHDVRRLVFAHLSLMDLSYCRQTSRKTRSIIPSVELCKELVDAAARGDALMVERLLAAGVPATLAVDPRGLSALHIAAKSGHTDVVLLLLNSGVEVDLRDAEGRTALHCAAQSPQVAVCALLLARGASVHGRTQTDASVLEVASQLEQRSDPQQLSVIKLLLDHGADPALPVENNAATRTLLLTAAAQNHRRLWELLRQYMPADHPDMAQQPDWRTLSDSD